MTDYCLKTADNQQEVILRRRRKAIAVFEKDMVMSMENGQRLCAKRFLNNLKKSEKLLRELESTKTSLSMRRNQRQTKDEVPGSCNDEVANGKNRHKTSPRRKYSDVDSKQRGQGDDKNNSTRIFSARLKEINKNLEVPFVKLSSYTKDDLKRPETRLELKRKVWEKINKHLEQNHALRPLSAGFVERCAGNIPRNVELEREKLCALTKLRLLSQLPLAPPCIDVEQVQCRRRELEKIERKVVKQFCDSLDPVKTTLPESFRLMDVREVCSKNAEVQKMFERALRDARGSKEAEKRHRSATWKEDENTLRKRSQSCSAQLFRHRHSHPFSST